MCPAAWDPAAAVGVALVWVVRSVSEVEAPPAVPGPAVPAGLGGCLPSCNLLEAGVRGRYAAALALRVRAAFFAEAERSAAGRLADASPPFRPPFLAGSLLTGLP